MMATGRPEPGDSGVCKIKKLAWPDRLRLYYRSRALSRALTERLAAWNLEFRSPERILEALGLAEADLELLKDLGGRLQGWHPFAFDAKAGAEAVRPASLGLVRLGRLRRRVSLTEAGRVLLLLTTIDPKIKKARPASKAEKDEADEPLP